MTSNEGVRALLGSRVFLRLWAIGGCFSAMRWFEVLPAALFTLDVTGSDLLVAVVSAARTLPMLLFGAFAGVISEAANRRHILLAGQITGAIAAATIALLAACGIARPWHVAIGGLVSGTVWATEMSTRRRMIGESVSGSLVQRAMALDSVTNTVTRLGGPVVAGVAYQFSGLAGASLLAACVYLVSALLVTSLRHEQASRRIALSRVFRDLAEAFEFARSHAAIGGVLAVTVAMNMFGFSYAALIAPIGRQVFMVSPTLTGILAGAESIGALLGGLWLAGVAPRLSGRTLMVGGPLLYMVCVMAMPFAPGFTMASAVLVVGGLGSAAFTTMQSALIVLHAPPDIRSRLMGLLTVCIGCNPLGILLIGMLASRVGVQIGVVIMAVIGVLAVAAIGLAWRRRDRRAAATKQPAMATED
jgi:MFS family permease